MNYIFLTRKSPKSFLFFGKVTHVNEPAVRTTKSGRTFTSYSMYIRVDEAVEFMSNFDGFIPPEDTKSMSFLVEIKEDVYNKMEKGMCVVINGGLKSYIHKETGNEEFVIVPDSISYYLGGGQTSDDLLGRFKFMSDDEEDVDDSSETVDSNNKGFSFLNDEDEE